jgi:hypothetical protein
LERNINGNITNTLFLLLFAIVSNSVNTSFYLHLSNASTRLSGDVHIIHLVLLNCRLGHIEDAQKHLSLATAQPDLLELHKLQTVEKHLGRCLDSRKAGDWKSVLRECDAAIAAGADSSALVRFCPSSTLLR